jgi:uracil-DNA glycosylase family 4
MASLDELNEQIARCMKCEIARLRTRTVPGEGNPKAELMFIGEAPGFHEDQQGRPFVGQAGQFLDQLLASIGLDRTRVFIANVIKCRPPSNRDPLPTEIQNCDPWLEQQIDIIQPRMVVTLGRYSMQKFFPGKTISRIHGTAVNRSGRLYFPMYHPAAALHQRSLLQAIQDDMKKIPEILAAALPPAEEEKPKPPEAQQLNLFED